MKRPNPNRKRENGIYLMVTEHERELIARKMEQVGVRNMGAYIRKQAMKKDLTTKVDMALYHEGSASEDTEE